MEGEEPYGLKSFRLPKRQIEFLEGLPNASQFVREAIDAAIERIKEQSLTKEERVIHLTEKIKKLEEEISELKNHKIYKDAINGILEEQKIKESLERFKTCLQDELRHYPLSEYDSFELVIKLLENMSRKWESGDWKFRMGKVVTVSLYELTPAERASYQIGRKEVQYWVLDGLQEYRQKYGVPLDWLQKRAGTDPKYIFKNVTEGITEYMENILKTKHEENLLNLKVKEALEKKIETLNQEIEKLRKEVLNIEL